MKKYILSRQIIGTLLIIGSTTLIVGLTACSSEADDEAIEQQAVLALDGGSDYVYLANGEQSDWTITDCPDWVTPVAMQGCATDSIRLYIESNRRSPLREGNITIRYANGRTHTTRAAQNNTQPGIDMRRSYAAGWGFDVRTYSDSRGLRDQIFNIQRIIEFNSNRYRNEPSTSSFTKFFYGEDASDLQNNMQGQLAIDGKFKVFSLDLQANFGMSAINNSKRIFSMIRDITGERTVYLNNLDPADAQKKALFTADFQALRQEVINSKGSDATIKHLVNNYGTHYVQKAELGGCYDYYYSSVYSSSDNSIDVEATLKFAYAQKFSFEADAKYANSLAKMDQETIEKFTVKGGDNVYITNRVHTGTITGEDTKLWKQSLHDGKWELLTFSLTPISVLFPENIALKIDSYMNRLYYSEVPVTRSE